MAKSSKNTKKKNKRKKARKKRAERKERIFRRSLFYAVSIFATFQFMLIPLQYKIYGLYLLLGVVGLLVILSELLYSRLHDYRKPFSFKVTHLRKKRYREHFVHHLVLPALTFFSGALFLFFNKIRLLDQFAILILTGTFFVLFYNISTTYQRLYSISRKTKVIFDFVNIIVFFFCVDVLINAVFYGGIWQGFIYVGVAVLTFLLIWLMAVVEHEATMKVIGLILLSSLITAFIAFVVLHIPIFNLTAVSLVITVGFYLIEVYWHHKFEGTFEWNTMLEYTLFALMAIILLLYL